MEITGIYSGTQTRTDQQKELIFHHKTTTRGAPYNMEGGLHDKIK